MLSFNSSSALQQDHHSVSRTEALLLIAAPTIQRSNLIIRYVFKTCLLRLTSTEFKAEQLPWASFGACWWDALKFNPTCWIRPIFCPCDLSIVKLWKNLNSQRNWHLMVIIQTQPSVSARDLGWTNTKHLHILPTHSLYRDYFMFRYHSRATGTEPAADLYKQQILHIG